MIIETLSSLLTDNDKEILLIKLGDRVQISESRLAQLLIKHYKRKKEFKGYRITGDTELQEYEIANLKKLLRLKEL